MVRVTIGLPTFNRAKFITPTINSILQQTFDDFEVIVLDDGSTDNTNSLLTSIANLDSRFKLVTNEKNRGLPASRNKIVALASNDLIFFLEDDLLLRQNCVRILHDSYLLLEERKIAVGGIGPRLEVPWANSSTNARNSQVIKINKQDGMVYSNFSVPGDSILEVPALHACSLIPKRVFGRIGGYDTNLYRGTSFREETDFYYRARRARFRLFYQPQAVALHLPAASGGTRRSTLLAGYYQVRNHLSFLGRFYSYKAIAMAPIFIFRQMLSAPSYLIRNRKNSIESC